MHTKHRIIFADSRSLKDIQDKSIDLVVTSPPYPMIEMWDTVFANLNPEIGRHLEKEQGDKAFELMHHELDKVWRELQRVVKPHGFVCINIGDATRTIGRHFQLYSNHSRIIQSLATLSFHTLPIVLWRKTANAPNKFMGSGMLPAGAYVTLEHEYILIFRKGRKREFKHEREKNIRNKSAIFWEERNCWFSDIWELPGVRQNMNNKKVRERSAAYPFELAYRLINMYSVKGDLILDPFLGTGTTVFSAITSARNSIGIEYDIHFKDILLNELNMLQTFANRRIGERINSHREFVHNRIQSGKALKYQNMIHDFPVMTRQEKSMEFEYITDICFDGSSDIDVSYTPLGKMEEFRGNTLPIKPIIPEPNMQYAMF